MLDGKIVASAPRRTQTFGRAGNHQQPLDIPTIGETVSHFWPRHRAEGGFEGALAAFRVSAEQKDWVLAKAVKNGSTSDIVESSEAQPAPDPTGLGIEPRAESRAPEQQTVDCRNLSLRLYNVDDSLQASLTNVAAESQMILSASERQDTGFVDISSRTRPGANSLSLQLTNYRGGYTYGYELRSNSTIVDRASCGNVGVVGCNNNDFRLGVVFTHTFSFQCSDSMTAGTSQTDTEPSPVHRIGDGGFGGGAYKVGGGVSQPQLISKIEPEYSEEARKAKWQGSVEMQIVVDEHGMPKEMKVTRALGRGLDQKALEAVAKWRFKPGMKDGKPVPVIATVQVNFRLL